MIVYGWDTESYLGYVKLLAYYGTDNSKDYIESSDTEQLLRFLFENGKNATYNVFWNIDYDIASILKPYIVKHRDEIYKKFRTYNKLNAEYKQLTESLILKTPTVSQLSRLNELEAELDEENPLKFDINNYKVTLYKNKSFSIRYKKNTVRFFDSANFYKTAHEGYMRLDTAGQKYIGLHKNAIELNINAELLNTKQGYYEANRNKIIEYCLNDCRLTALLFKKVINSFSNLNIPFPKKPYSKASISKQWLKDYKPELLASNEYYNKYSKLIDFKSYYKGGIFQNYKVGHFNKVFIEDIRSAYPYAISNLYSLIDSKFTYDLNEIKSKADYKFYEIEAVPDPILQTKFDSIDKIYYIKGNKPLIYYLTEYDKMILDEYNIPYKIKNAFGVITKKKLLFPELKSLYTNKSKIKKQYGADSVEYMNFKIFLNGLYGILVQSRPHTTKFTNYLYGSYITAQCRYIIRHRQKELIDKGAEIISIATDSIMYIPSDSMKEPLTTEDYLGGFEGDIYEDLTYYANGIYTFTHNGKKEQRKRGYEKLNLFEIQKSDLIHAEIIQHKPLKLMEAIIQNMPEQINIFQNVVKEFIPSQLIESNNPSEKFKEWTIKDFTKKNADLDFYNINDIIKL